MAVFRFEVRVLKLDDTETEGMAEVGMLSAALQMLVARAGALIAKWSLVSWKPKG